MFEINNFVTAGKFFLIIAGELVLIFVAVSFLVGILMEYLPPSRIRDFLSNKLMWVQYLLGSGLGAVTPFCSCSTVPITAGLLKGGVPFGPTMAFLFSSPVLNPIIIALLLSLFGLKVTVVYAAVTFLGSMVLAAVLSKMGMENQVKPLMSFQTASCCGESPKAPSCENPACCSRLLCVRDGSAPYYVSHLSGAGRMLRLGSKSHTRAIISILVLRCRLRGRQRNDGSGTFQREDETGIIISNRYVQGCVLVPAPWGGHRRFHLRIFPPGPRGQIGRAGQFLVYSYCCSHRCSHVHQGRDHYPHKRGPCRKRHGVGYGSGPHHRRGWGVHPGVDNSRVHVQEETRSGFRGERFHRRYCRWILGRMVGILITGPAELKVAPLDRPKQ